MRQARTEYFRVHEFGEDGGYSKTVVWARFGPLNMPVPNTAARRYAVRFHDLHHIVTGYHTDWRGEFQISAWEVGAGCANAWFAWAINLTGFFVGMFTIPRRTFRAFVRGRKSQSLYRFDFEKLLEQTVAEIRERTDCSIASEIATLADTGAFFFWFGAACVVVAPQFLAVLGPIIWLL